MPPFVNSKRREHSPADSGPPAKKQKAVASASKPHVQEKAKKKSKNKKKPQVRYVPQNVQKKTDVFDALDSKSASRLGKDALLQLDGSDETDSSSDSDSDGFEDVVAKPQVNGQREEEEDSSEEEVDWEDAVPQDVEQPASVDTPTEALELNLSGPQAPGVSYADTTGDKKQGPSKKEKQKRILAHSVHVQYLMWHNHVRNHWLNDQNVQKTMVSHMHQSQKMRIQYDNWKRKSGIAPQPKQPDPKPTPTRNKSSGKGKSTSERGDPRTERDWGRPAERLAVGQPDISRGDPLQQFLNVLATWWKQRFTITAPGLRKRGYMHIRDLKEQLQAWRSEESDIKDHGERIGSLKEFRAHAKQCEGSRDVGAQLFVALLRGLGIETRLVCSLQPLGFGWTKYEEAEPRQKKVASNTPHKAERKAVQKPQPGKRKASVGNSKADAIALSDTSDLSELPDGDQDSDDSIIDITPKKRPNMPYDKDLLFPNYWIEAISSLSNRVFPVEPFLLQQSVATNADHLMQFEPRGGKAEKARQIFAYVVAHSSDYSAKDVTIRYLKKHIWPGKTKGFRLPSARIPVKNRHGKVRGYYDVDWWKTVLHAYRRPAAKRSIADDIEDQGELKAVQPEKKAPKEGIPDTLDGFKRSAEYVLARHLRREEALLPGAESVSTFKTGKGPKAAEEPVYLRKDVVPCRTSESWHKEGRQVKVGQQAMKVVPIRAVTATRKREIEITERETGEKAMQGMYSKDQTEWIIPAPIKNGVIPKNGYGNMDAFVPQMIPKGAVHIPLRGTVRVCKKLEIDFAEAVTGFEFGNKMAVPVVEGVVVAEEHRDLVIDAWQKAEDERVIREAAKQEKLVLGTWRKFLMGLRIMERMKDEYEIDVDEHNHVSVNPFTNPKHQTAASPIPKAAQHEVKAKNEDLDDGTTKGGFFAEDAAETGGGFFHEGQDAEILPSRKTLPLTSGGEDDEDDEGAGGFMLEQDEPSINGKRPAEGKMRSLAEIAAEQALEDDSEEQESPSAPDEAQLVPGPISENKIKPKPLPKPRINAAATSKLGTSVQRKATPASQHKAGARLDVHDDSDELSAVTSSEDLSEASGSEMEVTAPVTTSTRATRASTRSAAKTGQDRIRSHFFKEDSLAEDDADSEEELVERTTLVNRNRRANKQR